jgi:hypothetical protein
MCNPFIISGLSLQHTSCIVLVTRMGQNHSLGIQHANLPHWHHTKQNKTRAKSRAGKFQLKKKNTNWNLLRGFVDDRSNLMRFAVARRGNLVRRCLCFFAKNIAHTCYAEKYTCVQICRLKTVCSNMSSQDSVCWNIIPSACLCGILFCACACRCVCVCVCMCDRTCTQVQIYAHTYAYACVYVDIYTWI